MTEPPAVPDLEKAMRPFLAAFHQLKEEMDDGSRLGLLPAIHTETGEVVPLLVLVRHDPMIIRPIGRIFVKEEVDKLQPPEGMRTTQYDIEHWKNEVASGMTLLGFEAWLAHMLL